MYVRDKSLADSNMEPATACHSSIEAKLTITCMVVVVRCMATITCIVIITLAIADKAAGQTIVIDMVASTLATSKLVTNTLATTAKIIASNDLNICTLLFLHCSL